MRRLTAKETIQLIMVPPSERGLRRFLKYRL